MSYYDQKQAPAEAYPAPPGQVYPPSYVAPPPAGYPNPAAMNTSQQVPGETKSRGEGFWEGCCAALCCCCVLDMCF